MDGKKDGKIREAPMTYDDYASIDDGNRYELADGVLEMLSAPAPRHQLVSQEIEDILKRTCKNDYVFILSPVDVIFGKHEIRQPDLIAIHRSRLSIISKRGIEGPPDLVVEVLSPSSAKRDRRDKMAVYSRYQVPEYWLVQPEFKQLEQYVLFEDRYQLRDIYEGDAPICSEKIACATFCMNDIWSSLPELPNA